MSDAKKVIERIGMSREFARHLSEVTVIIQEARERGDSATLTAWRIFSHLDLYNRLEGNRP